MKITVERLKQIIKEELNEVDLAQQFISETRDDEDPGRRELIKRVLDIYRKARKIAQNPTHPEYWLYREIEGTKKYGAKSPLDPTWPPRSKPFPQQREDLYPSPAEPEYRPPGSKKNQ